MSHQVTFALRLSAKACSYTNTLAGFISRELLQNGCNLLVYYQNFENMTVSRCITVYCDLVSVYRIKNRGKRQSLFEKEGSKSENIQTMRSQ
jgi:hypothetical protein